MPCIYWRRGYCTQGRNCRFRHAPRGTPPNTVLAPPAAGCASLSAKAAGKCSGGTWPMGPYYPGAAAAGHKSKAFVLSQLDDWLHRGDDPIVRDMNLYVYSMWVYRVEKKKHRAQGRSEGREAPGELAIFASRRVGPHGQVQSRPFRRQAPGARWHHRRLGRGAIDSN